MFSCRQEEEDYRAAQEHAALLEAEDRRRAREQAAQWEVLDSEFAQQEAAQLEAEEREEAAARAAALAAEQTFHCAICMDDHPMDDCAFSSMCALPDYLAPFLSFPFHLHARILCSNSLDLSAGDLALLPVIILFASDLFSCCRCGHCMCREAMHEIALLAIK